MIKQTLKAMGLQILNSRLLLIFLCILLLIYFLLARSNDWIKTTAVITDITYDPGTASSPSTTKAFVDYVVKGQSYSHILLDAFDTGMQIGNVVNIKYNPNDPAQITYDKPSYFFVGYIVGAIIIAIGVAILCVTLIQLYKERKAAHKVLIANPLFRYLHPLAGLLKCLYQWQAVEFL